MNAERTAKSVEVPESELSELDAPEVEVVAEAPPADDFQDKYVRLAAEFENYKKRLAREHERSLSFVKERVLNDWLEVVDSLERALATAKAAETCDTCWIEGTERTLTQARGVLTRYKIKAVESTGLSFDSSSMEALSTVPDPSKEDGVVIHTERTGYAFDDGTVLRPARVVVVRN